ncbi:peptidase [Marivivens donghaensis]|uniref:Peptidase n=1 Tax=Marivivens donghaensis TaxID=1699413 RepID=A0ABX0VXT2_9RHOB|nr:MULTISPECIES: peptidase [Marivivens]NIY72220.1 peptidase [Marivivens donghaensis]
MAVLRRNAFEETLKNLALGLGILSTVAIVQDWYPLNMFLSLPFCVIWWYLAWLRTEPQLKWVNILFTGFYLYGIGRYVVLGV